MAWRDYIPGFLRPTEHLSASSRDVPTSSEEPVLIRPGEYAAPVRSFDNNRNDGSTEGGKPDTSIYGATGTPIISGFVTDLLEYNPDLRGRAALPVYEQMRRSDADVAALLAAIKLPIRSAEFSIVPGAKENEPEYELAKELAQFVEDSLFGGLEYSNSLGMNFSQRFESVIDNALLCLDYGCSGSEDLWRIDGKYVRLSRVAPRLPTTFYRFHVEADGETLQAVEQWGYRGSSWVTARVPSNKFTLFSLRQEGANFYGRSVLREAYQHWYIKNALYRIDSVACERNGMGVPTITLAPTASPDDKATAYEFIQNLSAHESMGIVLPNGATFKLEATIGTARPILPSIQHHSEMICRSGLAMFMTLGSSATGSRALGSTMVDFFQLAEEAVNKFICDTISETTIRRLCDYNFFRGDNKPLPYPRLAAPNITVLNPLDLIGAIKDVASATTDLIQPDDETENWIRKKVGMPLKSAKPRIRYSPVAQRMDETGGDPGAVEEGKKSEVNPEQQQKDVQDKTDSKNKAADDKQEAAKPGVNVVKKKAETGAPEKTEKMTLGGAGSGGAREGAGRPTGPGKESGTMSHSERAKLSYVPATKQMQETGDAWQNKLASVIGAESTADNMPFDLHIAGNGIEVKTIQTSKKDRIEMRPDSRVRKEEYAKQNGVKAHTVGVDLRGGKPVIYYKEGVGAFRFGSMERVTMQQLKLKFK